MNRQREIKALIREAWKRDSARWDSRDRPEEPRDQAPADSLDLVLTLGAVFGVLIGLAFLLLWPFLVIDVWPGTAWWAVPCPYLPSAIAAFAGIRRARYVTSDASAALGVKRVHGLLLAGPFVEPWRKAGRYRRPEVAKLRELVEAGSAAWLRVALSGEPLDEEPRRKLDATVKRAQRRADSIVAAERAAKRKGSADLAEARRPAQVRECADDLAAYDAAVLAIMALDTVAPSTDDVDALEDEAEMLTVEAGVIAGDNP